MPTPKSSQPAVITAEEARDAEEPPGGEGQTADDAAAAEDGPAPDEARARRPRPRAGEGLLRVGRYAWALLGVLAVLAILGIVVGRLTLVVVPLVLALFPAALLAPVSAWMKDHGVPGALAAIIAIVGTFAVMAAVISAIVPIVAAEMPALADSLTEGIGELEELISDLPFAPDIDGIDGLFERAREQIGEAEGIAGGAMEAAFAIFEGIAGFFLLLVALFFYLKDGGRIAAGVRDTLPVGLRPHAHEMGSRAWHTLGSYFRGQLLVALVDAVFIGLGLLLLGVPLAVPLAVLVFFGGLFPIVGAVVTGAVAVLVALADAGLVTALIVAGLVLAVQQLESNVLEPVILSRAIALHPLMVIVAITAGAVTLGILGAFLAVPVAASIARAMDYLRGTGEDEAEEEEEEEEEDEEAEEEPGEPASTGRPERTEDRPGR